MTNSKDQPGLDFLWPAAAKRAAMLRSRLGRGNTTFWEDICDVLLDPLPDPRAAEAVRRWLREQVEQDLLAQLGKRNGRHLTVWASRIAPHMIWKLPASAAPPPPRYHRRIAAVLLPHKLKLLERRLARLAFSWHFRTPPHPSIRDDDRNTDGMRLDDDRC